MRRYAWEAQQLIPLLGMKPLRFFYSLALPLLQIPRVGLALIHLALAVRRAKVRP
jgi:hypothetical protein